MLHGVAVAWNHPVEEAPAAARGQLAALGEGDGLGHVQACGVARELTEEGLAARAAEPSLARGLGLPQVADDQLGKSGDDSAPVSRARPPQRLPPRGRWSRTE
jgi:hypothetical protein